MKHVLAVAALALLAYRPAAAAQISVMEPADKSVIKGNVQLRLKTELEPGEQFLANPEIRVKNEYGQEVAAPRCYRDMATGIVSASLDTTKLKDGLYLVSIVNQALRGDKVAETREELNLGVRNGKAKPAKFTVELPDKPYAVGDACEFTVHVLDEKGLRVPAARVEYKVDKGDVNTPAEITDRMGSAAGNVDSEEAQTVTLTITVEGLPPVTKSIKFVEK